MAYIINNNLSNDKNDWRFQGQDKYLMNAKLWIKQYKKHSEQWEHEHCEFCWGTFCDQPECLHRGYCTEDEKHWICEKCFNDFNNMFKWQVVT